MSSVHITITCVVVYLFNSDSTPQRTLCNGNVKHSHCATTGYYDYLYTRCRYSLATACVNTHAAVLAAVSKRTLTPVPEALTSLNTSLTLLGFETPTTATDGQ
jgi:hypothetical protein